MKSGRVQRFFHRVILSVVLTTTLLAGASAPRPAEAIIPTLVSSVASDIWQIGGNILETLGNAYDKFSDQIKAQLEHASAVAYRQGIRRFLQNLAYDSATWIASGGKGQKPLFITAGWGTYLRDHADAALGDFVDGLSQEVQTGGSCSCVGADGVGFSKSASSESECTGLTSGPEQCTWQPEFSSGLLSGLNLCQPPSDILLRINLGVAPAGEQVNRPRCTASQIFNNWQRSITERDFLPRFQSTFDPSQNPLAVALNIHALGQERSFKAEQAAKEKRQESSGFLGVEGLDGEVYTPSSVVRDFFTDTLNASKGGELEYTGDVIADAIDIFTNTLVSNVLNNLISKGLSGGSGPDSPRRRAAGPTLTNPEAVITSEGVAAARIRLARDVAPKFSVPGQYDILTQLVTCRDQSKPAPNTCAITENMRGAIAQRMTVRDAVEKGLFNADGTFGFLAGNDNRIEPNYTDGIPYRTILLLRKYRIVPVGWEVAAQYIKHFDTNQHSLRGIMNEYDNPKSPFYRLIDPNWSLLRPDAYCKLQGPGPEIVGEEVSQAVDSNGDKKYDGPNERPPALQITRAEYCTDEQTCLKRDDKGNCAFYGYCQEEKRIWDFGQNQCQPQFNTCTTLERKSDGATVSYLLNSVDFDSCDERSDGCTQYSRWRNLNVQNAASEDYWESDPPRTVYLNNRTKACPEGDAGCRAFIRTGISMPLDALPGVNLVVNPSFERLDGGAGSEWSSTPAGSVIDTASYDGKNGYWTTGGDTLSQTIETGKVLGPSVYQVSFFAKRSAAGGTIQLNVPTGVVEFVGTNTNQTPSITNSWQQYVATVTFDSTVVATSFAVELQIPGQTALDAVKVTPGVTGSAYTPYGVGISNASIHLKRAPEYLSGRLAAGSYFGGGRSCRPTRPADNTDDTPDQAECKPYARYCLPEEAGCLSYAPTNKGTPITSVRGDTCPAECVGYDTYTQSRTFFEEPKFVDLIPKTSRKCPATRVGCDEFTNLDIEQRGGEAKEYYQQMRLCKKPNTGHAEGVYYTWEGSDTAGYQLRVFQLFQSNLNSGQAPCTNASATSATQATCNDTAANVVNCQSSFGSNPDCREFYDANGAVSYRLFSKTVTISDNCLPYRKSESTSADCNASSGWWDAAAGQCFYDAVPKQGKTCPASAAGCRQYRGGSSANYQVIVDDQFENGTSGWTDGVLSSVSSNVGGHSYEALSSAGYTIKKKLNLAEDPERDVVAATQYELSFWARKSGSAPAGTIGWRFNPATPILNAPVLLTDEWQFFSFEPVDGVFGDQAEIELWMWVTGLSAGERVFYDNIRIKSNINTHYLIKNSSQIPQSCDSPVQYLGCQQYKVSDGKTRNIYQFGNACHQKVVGCEALIDTQNTTTGLDAAVAKMYGNHYEGYCSNNPSLSCDPAAASPCGAGNSCVTNLVVPADSIDFLVNAKDKQCKKESQGCELLGTPQTDPTKLPIDLMFVIDNSTSINPADFDIEIAAMRKIALELGLSKEGIHAGVVSFGPSILRQQLTDSASLVAERIGEITNQDSTPMDTALTLATSELGSFRARSNVTKIIVLVTDGQPNDPTATTAAAAAARAAGIEIYGVGVGPGVNAAYMSTNIVSPPASDHYISAANFAGLEDAMISVQEAISRRVVGWQSVSLLNNPDSYGETLCREVQQMCQLYTDTNGNQVRFKDPQGRICEYRSEASLPGWYVIGTTASAPNCNQPVRSIRPRTLVAGGIPEPRAGWVGSCPVVEDSCRELRDRRSDDGRNILYNGSLVLAENNLPVRWSAISSGTITYVESEHYVSPSAGAKGIQQDDVLLQPRTYYVLSAETATQSPSATNAAYLDITCGAGQVDYDNDLPYAFLSPRLANTYERFSLAFYVTSNDPVLCTVQAGLASELIPGVRAGEFAPGEIRLRNISLREMRLHYQLASRVDKTSCGGTVNNTDCVLIDGTAPRGNDPSLLLPGDAASNADVDTSPVGTVGSGSQTANVGMRDEYSCMPGILRCRGTDRACTKDEDCQLHYDSGSVPVKVRPDRECGSWLACTASNEVERNGKVTQVCTTVESCDQLTDSGLCARKSADFEDTNLTFTAGNADLMRDRSGFSRAGFDWGIDNDFGETPSKGGFCSNDPLKACGDPVDCPGGVCQPRMVQGNFSPAVMEQLTNRAKVTNGNFESSGKNGRPTSWIGWGDGNNMLVVDNPVTAKNKSIRYPMEGAKFLEVNANHVLVKDSNFSNFIPVAPNKQYVLSAYVNTKFFTGESVEVRVFEFDGNRQPIQFGSGNWTYHALLNIDGGRDWTLLHDTFTTHKTGTGGHAGASTEYIRIQLAWNVDSNPSPQGLYYIDDINIESALRYQKNEGVNQEPIKPDFPYEAYESGENTLDYHYAAKSCRLYPKTNALSCRYADESGYTQRGKYGYCVEWDPQNPNYCLQWWPVDNVAGEDPEDARAGYDDRTPLFMCTSLQTELTKIADNVYIDTGDDNDSEEESIGGSFGLPGTCSSKPERTCWTEAPPGGQTCRANKNEGDCVPSETHQPIGVCIGFIENRKTGCSGSNYHRDFCRSGLEFCGPKWTCLTARDALKAADPAGPKYDAGQPTERPAHDLDGYNLPKSMSDIDLSKFEIWSLEKELGDFDGGSNQTGHRAGSGISTSEDGFNFFAVIDKKTRALVKFKYNVWDDEDGRKWCGFNRAHSQNSNFVMDIAVMTPQACDVATQVVTSDGTNAAWASRLVSGSTYVTSPLGYSRSADYAPFGGLVAPEPPDDPESWDSSDDDGTQPLYFETPMTGTNPTTGQAFAPPYQARSGQPYACSPPNDPSVGIGCLGSLCSGGSNNGQSCSSNSDCPGGSCSSIPRTCVFVPGQCVGGSLNGASCDTNSECVPGCTFESSCAAGGRTGTCDSADDCRACTGGTNDGTACSSDDDCEGGGQCPAGSCVQNATGLCSGGPTPGASCASDAACGVDSPAGFCNSSGTGNCSPGVCNGGTNDGAACLNNSGCPAGTCSSTSCTSDGQCPAITASCAAPSGGQMLGSCNGSATPCNDNFDCPGTGDFCNIARSSGWENACIAWTGGVISTQTSSCDGDLNPLDNVKDGLCIPGRCVGGSSNGKACINSSGCSDGGICNRTTLTCNSDRDCSSITYANSLAPTQPYHNDAIQVLSQLFVESYGVWQWSGKCQGGDNVGKLCSGDAECTGGGTCVGLKQYVPTSLPDLSPPTSRCPGNTRPAGGEVCAVAPAVPFVSASPAVIGRGTGGVGTVSLNFTTLADPDQLPIKRYRIDWGDGELTEMPDLHASSRSSTTNPVRFVRTYSYDQVKSCADNPSQCASANTGTCPGNGVAGDRCTYCDGSGVCFVTPRVQITDNWGWCNGKYTGGTPPTLASQNGYYDRSVAGACDTNQSAPWSFYTTIKVERK